MKRIQFTFLSSLVLMSAYGQNNLRELSIKENGIEFSVWSPNADSARVNLYATGKGGKQMKSVAMSKNSEGRWRASVGQQYEGRFYTFQINKDGQWLEETPGIFATAVGVNGERAAAIDISKCAPKGWATDKAPKMESLDDVVLYELHHRDYTISPTSSSETPGKFLALTEPDKLKHLKELGITHVHLLPSFDYASVDESKPDVAQYNWGYDPLNYNVPEGSYSTDATDPSARILEFRQMVMAMHNAGLRVVMDVVYNHVMDVPKSPFERTAPGYFFRKNADGTLGNASGCNNETASEKEMMRRYMVESVKFWATEYHVDGFRFDLMGIHDIETMNAIRKALNEIDPSIIMYGEGWAAATPLIPAETQAMKVNMAQMPGISAFGDEMRDAIRGPWNDDARGAFLVGVNGQEESIKMGIVGAINHPQINFKKVNYSKAPWASEPTQMVSYVSCHDDMNLADRIKHTAVGASSEELRRLDKLAFSIILSSQGLPFMYCGDEIMRDRKGVHNCYNSPDSINAIDWTLKQTNADVLHYVSEFVKMRHSHPAFHMGKAELVRKNLKFIKAPKNCIAFTINGKAVGDEWGSIIVIINGQDKAINVAIPQNNYTKVCHDGQINLDGSLGHVSGKSTKVARKSVTILHN